MTLFLVALAAFLLLHSVPALPAIRMRLIGLLGRRLYLILYSVVSLLTLAWVFHAALQLDYVELWPPMAWQAWVPIVLSPIAFFLLVAGLVSPNPGSITLRRGNASAGAITTITRHPVLWSFALWAGSHLVANGDLRSLLLFGAFALFALVGIATAERRARRRQEPGFAEFERSTTILPFAALLSGRAHWRVDRAMLVALVLTAVLTFWLLAGGHAALFGADPLAMTAI
ncbi:MAG: NnrU family protein [Pelagibacterium sp. SCN 63-23]|nr:MAG: NnrU family protein [Pelagibacterium sp. SCN 63-23]